MNKLKLLAPTRLAPAALAALAFSLSACTPQQALGTVAKVPTFETQSIRLSSVRLGSGAQAELTVTLRVNNPNAFPIRLKNFHTDLFLSGQRSAQVDLPNINLPAHGSALQTAHVRLPINLASASELLRVARGEQVAYRLDGTFTADLGALGQPSFGPLTLRKGEASMEAALTKDILLFLIVILFLIHEFEEMIMVSPWVRRQLQSGSTRTQRHYFVRRFAKASQAVPVLMIGIETLILSAITIISLGTGYTALMIGFLILYTLHLFAHISEWFVYRCYTPSLITSILTLPLCLIVGYALFLVSQATFISIVISTIIMLVLFALNFALLGFLEPKAIQWFKNYECPNISQEY